MYAASFVAIMVANAVVKSPPLMLSLFRNMYLAGKLVFFCAVVWFLTIHPAIGTIIFGGGPVSVSRPAVPKFQLFVLAF